MRAMLLKATERLTRSSSPLVLEDVPIPEPGPGEVRLRIGACGVCHTEIDEIEGRVAVARLPMILGHQVVGRVDDLGADVTLHGLGDRVGVGWIHRSSGGADENLHADFRATGRDVDGGYAEYLTVHERYAHPIPSAFSDVEAAPLLCAGAVGFRALRLTGLVNGEPLGLTGFGSSAHLVLQLAKHRYPQSPIFVFAREPAQQRFALELGADWAGAIEAKAPVALAAIVDTTPAWRPVLEALRNLRPGGRLVINAIRKEAGDRELMATIDYAEHLWLEKEIKTVANVAGADIAEFLSIAAAVPLRPAVETYAFEDANRALLDLKFGTVRGAKVLTMDPPSSPSSGK